MSFDRNLAAFVAFGLRGKHLLEVLLVALDDVGHAVEFLELVLEAAERLLLVAVELAVLLLLDVELAFLAINRLGRAEHEVVVSLNLSAEITLLLVDGVVDLLELFLDDVVPRDFGHLLAFLIVLPHNVRAVK